MDRDGAIRILAVLHDGGHRTADGEAGAIERMDVAGALKLGGVTVLDVGAPRLEVPTVGA